MVPVYSCDSQGSRGGLILNLYVVITNVRFCLSCSAEIGCGVNVSHRYGEVETYELILVLFLLGDK